MRGGPSTGMPTRPRRATSCSALGLARRPSDHRRSPASVQEIYEETIRAFNLAEQFGRP